MKTFLCHFCGAFVGEMYNGMFSRSAICVCKKCRPKCTAPMPSDGVPPEPIIDMPDFLKGFMGGAGLW